MRAAAAARALPVAAALRARGGQILLLGLGISGCAMAAYLARRGVQVWACDEGAVAAAAWAKLAALGVQRLDAGAARRALDGPPAAWAGLVCSPGVDPHRHPLAAAARARGLPIWGELSLCGPLPCPSVGITGTNGKSTTTELCGALLRSRGLRPFVGGNLGEPLVSFLDAGDAGDAQVAVLELSSYMLEHPLSFAPQVGVLLNLSPDHLARHGSMAAYAAAKGRLLEGLAPGGRAILNAACPQVVALAARSAAPIWWFHSGGGPLPGPGVRLLGDGSWRSESSAELQRFGSLDLRHGRLLGHHNRDNALAAALCVAALQPAARAAQQLPAYRAFAGLPHRLQLAGTVAGVRFVNDSKATNDAAAAIAIAAMQGPTVLLLGGQDKGGGYAAVCAALARAPVKRVLCFGAAQEPLLAALAAARLPMPCQAAAPEPCGLPLAQALAAAAPGDTVLLAPACASFDAFPHYAARGEALLAWVAARAPSPLSPPVAAGPSAPGGPP